MKGLRHILILFLIIIATGCSSNNPEESEWNSIKNSSDFGLFFNFALKTTDSTLFNLCADSLDKIISTKKDFVLHYLQFYDLYNDSSVGKIELEDVNVIVDYWIRNVFIFSIEGDGQFSAYYLDSLLPDYKSELVYLFETEEISYNVPETRTESYKGRDYVTKKLGTHIYTQTHPYTTNHKTPWRSIFYIINDIKGTIQTVKENKATELFSSEYSVLNAEQKNLIDGLVPIWIEIYFSSYLPPPAK